MFCIVPEATAQPWLEFAPWDSHCLSPTGAGGSGARRSASLREPPPSRAGKGDVQRAGGRALPVDAVQVQAQGLWLPAGRGLGSAGPRRWGMGLRLSPGLRGETELGPHPLCPVPPHSNLRWPLRDRVLVLGLQDVTWLSCHPVWLALQE